jgi:hypothetical protein
VGTQQASLQAGTTPPVIPWKNTARDCTQDPSGETSEGSVEEGVEGIDTTDGIMIANVGNSKESGGTSIGSSATGRGSLKNMVDVKSKVEWMSYGDNTEGE